MKKLLLVLMTALIISPLFAITDTTDTSLLLQGFYNPSAADFKMTVRDYNNERILYATNALITDSNVGAGNNGIVFKWELTGVTKNKTTVSFTFTTLQAYRNDTYYRPAYTVSMTQNQSTSNGSTISSNDDSFYSNSTKSKTYTKTSQNYQFSNDTKNNFTATYSGKTNKTPWVRSGQCMLNITDYQRNEGTYEYTAWVKVEFTAE